MCPRLKYYGHWNESSLNGMSDSLWWVNDRRRDETSLHLYTQLKVRQVLRKVALLVLAPPVVVHITINVVFEERLPPTEGSCAALWWRWRETLGSTIGKSIVLSLYVRQLSFGWLSKVASATSGWQLIMNITCDSALRCVPQSHTYK